MKFLRQSSTEHSCLGNFRDTKFSLLYYTFSLLLKSPYSVPMRENADQENFEYGHFICSVPIHSCSNFYSSSCSNFILPGNVRKPEVGILGDTEMEHSSELGLI